MIKYLSVIIITVNIVYSQTISIGLGSGINMIQGNNFYTEDFGRIGLYTQKNGTQTNFAGLGLKNEYDLSINAKIGFSSLPVIFIAQLHYLPMRGNQSVEMWDFLATHSHYENVKTINDIWSYGFGLRYNAEFNNLYPFCSASFLINNWNNAILQFDYQEHLSTWAQYKNGIRYGYNISMGLGYNISDLFEIEIEGSYSLLNEYNRRDGEVKMNTVNTQFKTYYTILP